MKINPNDYFGSESNFQITSDKWYMSPFWYWFKYGTMLVFGYSLIRGNEITPDDYSDADWNREVNKRTKRCCCKFQFNWFQSNRGLSNAFAMYKDTFYAFFSPHANVWVATMLQVSIFIPFVLNCIMFNHLGISDDKKWKKPWRYLWMYFGWYTFEIDQELMYSAEIVNIGLTLSFSTSV
jgi:hypothetical protein